LVNVDPAALCVVEDEPVVVLTALTSLEVINPPRALAPATSEDETVVPGVAVGPVSTEVWIAPVVSSGASFTWPKEAES
jgi:hypothetical protein